VRQFAVAVAVAVQLVHDFEMLPNVAYPTVAEGYRPKPSHKTGNRRQGDEHEPEPDEDVDLLVEQVDGQDALDGVRQNGAHLPDTEVTESNSREARRCSVYRLSRNKIAHDFDTVQMIVSSKEEIQQKQLHDDIPEVQNLGRHVQSQQVVAVAVAASQAEIARHDVLQTDAASASVLALVVEVVVEMPDHVLDCLVAALRIQRVLDRVSCLDEVVDVDARPLAEHLPDD